MTDCGGTLSQEWLYGEGLKLPVEMVYDTALAREAFTLAERWNESRSETNVSKLQFKESDMASFNANQKSTRFLLLHLSIPLLYLYPLISWTHALP